jgi:RimJ/RimL family protein N-acetyltransferase
MKLRGQRVIVRPMRRDDVDAMARWRPFADPLYQPFDFPRRTRSDHDQWFVWRSQDPSRRLYAIENEEGQVIGSLTLRGMVGRQEARLGITLGADFVSQGYGTEALKLFLDYYFGTMAFAQLVLDVAATNLRAVRTYQALGFRQTGQHFRPASHPSYRILQQESRYQHLLPFFRRHGAWSQVLFYDMTLTRKEWQTHLGNAPTPEPDLKDGRST